MNSLGATIAVIAAAIVALTAQVEADAKCQLCQEIARKVNASLTQDVVASFAAEALKVCDQMILDDRKDRCKVIVQQLVEQAEYLLRYTPKELCQKLGACSQDIAYLRQLMGDRRDMKEIERMRDRYMANYQKEILSLLATRTRSSSGCETCLMVLKQLQQLVKMPQVVNAFDKAIEFTCEKIGGANVEECIEQAKGYVHEAIKFIQEQNPGAICSIFGECESVETKFFKRVSGSVICDECKMAIDKAKAKLDDKEVQAQIEALITQVCNRFFDNATREKCHQFASQTINDVMERLESSSSAEICQALHVC